MSARRRTLLPIFALFVGAVFFQAAPAPAMSSESAPNGIVGQPRADARRQLENLHRRVVAHAKADEDDKDATSASASASAVHQHAISPERAAELAIRSHGGGRVTYIELQTRNGRPAYHVRLDRSDHFVDAATGGVTSGGNK